MPPMCCSDDLASSDRDRAAPRPHGWLRLCLAVAVILLLWLIVLPWLADQPPVRRHIEFLEQRRIDPSAMFYTELETLPGRRARGGPEETGPISP